MYYLNKIERVIIIDFTKGISTIFTDLLDFMKKLSHIRWVFEKGRGAGERRGAHRYTLFADL